MAHGVGWVVRAVGRQAATARDLDPEHRRDGAGLLLLGLAILLGVAVWFSGAGPVGERLASTTRLFVGAIAAALPLLLLVAAIRLMREPSDPATRGRGLVGWTALLVATASLLHLGQDPVGPGQLEYAGGLIGKGVGGLLERLVTGWVAVPLLVLLFSFGLLVVTATPINKIPQRLAYVRDFFLGRPLTPADQDEADELGEDSEIVPAPRRRGSSRRRQGAFAGDDEADDDAIVHDTVLLPRAPAKVPSTRKVLEPPEHTPMPTRAEQLAITGLGGDYKLPPPNLLHTGTPAKTRSKANDEVIAALTGVFEQFDVDAAGDGVHPRPDGHPL